MSTATTPVFTLLVLHDLGANRVALDGVCTPTTAGVIVPSATNDVPIRSSLYPTTPLLFGGQKSVKSYATPLVAPAAVIGGKLVPNAMAVCAVEPP